MSLRVSQIMVQLVLLDEHDAPQRPDPLAFQGDAEGTAVEKAQAFLKDLPGKLDEQ